MDDVRIRRATADDAEPLARVYRSADSENRKLGFPARAGSATEHDVVEWIEERRVYVATVEGEIVGGVRLEATDVDRVKTGRLGVHEDWKGKGVGSRLLEYREYDGIVMEKGVRHNDSWNE